MGNTRRVDQAKPVETKPTEAVRLVTFAGQRSQEELAGLMAHARRSAVESRDAYLKAHPDYIACAVAGCLGLVSPAFTRLAPDGSKWGLCPRQAAHALLVPELFGQTTPTA